MSVVYLQRGWDHSAADRGSAGGSAGRPRSPCSLGLAPAAKRLYSAQHPGTGTPERNRLARGSPRPGAPGPLEAETKPLSVRQRQAGSAGCRSPALPGRSRRLVPGSRSAALRGGARGGRR